MTSLFDWRPAFDGGTYQAEHDRDRLGKQLEGVRDYLQRHDWVTLEELERNVIGTAASLSARVRDLRKPRFGRHTIECRRVRGGLYEYRMTGKENGAS